MYKISIKIHLLTSLAIAMLLSLSPIMILIEHHSWIDVLDKVILIITAFFITFFNLLFQKNIQEKSFPILKTILYTFVFNIFLFGSNILIRIPFWNIIPFHKPPLLVLGSIDLVRSVIIGFTSFWVILFLNKNINQMTLKIKLNELENQTLQLQLKNLTAQLQPHFFFNSLNVLAELIHIDTQKSDHFIQHLSTIFRYVLTNQDTPIIALNDEINFIKSYLFLLKIRFESSVHIQYDINKSESFLIPSLCSLIVLENIVKHNNIDNIKIKISVSKDSQKEHQELIIWNSKNKKSKNRVESMGYGLANINEKCKLLFEKNVVITETEDSFEVKIPLNKIS